MSNIENSGAAIKYIILILLVLVNGVYAGKDTQELFKYYGFEELRIIKTDWATGGLNVSDINGAGKNDLVLANN